MRCSEIIRARLRGFPARKFVTPSQDAAVFRCSDELHAQFKTTFHAAHISDSVPDYTALDNLVDEFARDGKARSIPPEKLLVALKECMDLSQLPADGGSSHRAVRDHAVTRALDAYYEYPARS